MQLAYAPTTAPAIWQTVQNEAIVALEPKSNNPRLTIAAYEAGSALPPSTDRDNAVELWNFCMNAPAGSVIALDTETEYNPKIKKIFPSQQNICFVQVAINGKAVCSRVLPSNYELIRAAVWHILTTESFHVLAHNSPFDVFVCDKFLRIEHKHIKATITDTMLLSQFVYLGYGKEFRHSLAHCLRRELGVTADKSAQASDWRLPVEADRWEYINNDVLYLEPLYKVLMGRLDAESPVLRKGWELQRAYHAGPATSRTLNGFMVDVPMLRQTLVDTEVSIEAQLVELTGIVGQDTGYAAEAAEIQRKIDNYQATITANKKRKPGVAEGHLAKQQAALIKLSPNFKFRSNPKKLALLEQMYPLIQAAYYRQAIRMIETTGAAVDTDGLFLTKLATTLEAAEQQSDDAEITADNFAVLINTVMEEYEVARADIARQVQAVQGKADIEQRLQAIAEKYARVNAYERCQTTSATNWKLIHAVLSMDKASLAPHELTWLRAVALFMGLATASKKASMVSSYLTLATIDPTNPRLHSSYRVLGAATNRQSSTDPNLQNIDRTKKMRKHFIASPGYRMAVFDASQIELRVAFALANEERGLQAFRDGKDLHTVTALLIWGKVFIRILAENGVESEAALTADPDLLYARSYYFFDDYPEYTEGNLYYYLDPEKGTELTPLGEKIKSALKEFRQLAKSANFGLLYGAGWRGLQGYIFSSSGQVVSEAEARDLRNKFFTAYPALSAWHKRLQADMDMMPVYMAISDDTRRLMPPSNYGGMYLPNKNLKVTVAANTPVQGLSAIILKQATMALWDKLQSDPSYRGIRLLASVHDEVVLEIPMALDMGFLETNINRVMAGASQHPMLGGKVEIKYSGGMCMKTNTWADK